jgi:hypothetical protein
MNRQIYKEIDDTALELLRLCDSLTESKKDVEKTEGELMTDMFKDGLVLPKLVNNGEYSRVTERGENFLSLLKAVADFYATEGYVMPEPKEKSAVNLIVGLYDLFDVFLSEKILHNPKFVELYKRAREDYKLNRK